MVFSNNLLLGAANQGGGGYTIDYSGQFKAASSAYMYRTAGSAGSERIATYRLLVRRAKLGAEQDLVHILRTASGAPALFIRFTSADVLDIVCQNDVPAVILRRVTTQVFRDVSSTYDINIQIDGNQTTDACCTIEVNGVTVTSFSTKTNLGSATNLNLFNTSKALNIGRNPAGISYFDGNLGGDSYIVDGTNYDSSYSGEFDANGNWTQIEPTGITWGTNGVHWDFADSGNLGTDVSGNGNNFTNSGVVQVTDTPTNVFATLNPLWAAATLSDGNLVASNAGTAAYQWAISTVAIPTTGKWVFEAQRTAGTFGYVGICQMGNHNVNTGNNYQIGINVGNGDIVKNSSVLTTVTAPTSSVVRIEYDADADDLTIFDDGVSIYTNTAVGLTGQNSLHFYVACYSGTTFAVKFGATGFTGTPSTGYKALSTTNLSEPAIKDGSAHFQTTLYTGTGSSLTVNQSGNSTFTPDFAWLKGRSGATDHALYDILRGTQARHESNNDDAEVTADGGVTAFGAGSLTLGTLAQVNTNTATYVAWQWKANGAGVSNTDGSITSTVSANPTAGISIVKYTGTGANGSVGHGLGAVPKLIIIHDYSHGNIWQVYHASIGNGNYLVLSTTAASAAGADRWNSTSPDAAKFYLGNNGNLNSLNHSMIAYCFAEIEGFSKFGSYIGNGSANGPLVYCGFKPAFVLWKNASTGATDWYIKDTARDTYNVMTKRIYPNANYAEDINTSNDLIDMVSNGFKIRSSANAATNGSGNTIIFAAFAEHPFGGEGVSPAKAR
jgi:hypothetical protein